jgi:hypothetical protein
LTQDTHNTQVYSQTKRKRETVVVAKVDFKRLIIMGRKQKLRQEKRNIKNKAAAAVEVTAAAADATSDAISFADAAKKIDTVEVLEKAEALENQFPKSDMYFQATADTDNISGREQYELFKQGATEDGCIHCMYLMGKIILMQAHLALPWFLEGAIRGSSKCMMSLMWEVYCSKVDRKADALQDYWGKINKKYHIGTSLVDSMKILKCSVTRKCVICSKTDTKTLTLQQCQGCSVYCYCGEGCQAIHWEERKHRNECKQVHILNKYHKPYAKEIRDAVIRGDKEIPSLEKLRYKLGLTRPEEEYEEFFEPTHNGNPFNPGDYLTGRDDGTLWVGSFPNSPIGT